jgi:LPS-assembly protein
VLQTTRSAFSLQHQQQITPPLALNLDLNKVSDSRYFVDLHSQVRQVSQGNLQQAGTLTYNSAFAGIGYSMSAMMQRWQTLQDPLAPITPPYARLPQININTARADIAGRFDVVVPAEFVRFSHSSLVEGTRLSFNPTLAAPYVAPGYFFTPKWACATPTTT